MATTINEICFFSASEDSNINSVEATKTWIRNFIANPHPNLKRPGGICPFVARSYDNDLMYFAHLDISGITKKSYDETMIKLVDVYYELEAKLGKTSDLLSMVIVLDGMNKNKYREFIEQFHAQNRLTFMKRGLMFGEFHPHYEKPSVRAPDLLPLQSPRPCFAIRKISIHDMLFINDQNQDIELRIEELRAYTKNLILTDGRKCEIVKMLESLQQKQEDEVE